MIWKRDKKINIIFFLFLLFIYTGIMFFFFRSEALRLPGKYGDYISDMNAYIAYACDQDLPYEYPYPILFWLTKVFMLFFGPHGSMALAVTLLNSLSVVFLKYYFDRYLEVNGDFSSKKALLSSALTFTVFFISMLYPLAFIGSYRDAEDELIWRYIGVFSPNPFQNATYLAARPFTVPAFFSIVDALEIYEKKNKWYTPTYLFFSCFLFLATLAKPSFSLVLVITMGSLMIFRLIRSRLRGMKAFWQLGIYFIPTFVVLLVQYGTTFVNGEKSVGEGIGISFLLAWKTCCDNIPKAIFLAAAFPLAVLAFAGKDTIREKTLRFSAQFYLVSLMMMLFLYEKGERLEHMNFAWGYMYGLFFFHICALMYLTDSTLKKRQPIWKIIIQWGFYSLHLICGLDYFRILLGGGSGL